MILIAHRGNINGKSHEENHPNHINKALNAGYNVEVDVWCIFGKWSLGHDEPQYIIDKKFLQDSRIWCHAKTINTFYNLLNLNTICFFHNNDDVTLTSNGYIWTFPGKLLTKKSICVLPDWNTDIENCAGICSDRINIYK